MCSIKLNVSIFITTVGNYNILFDFLIFTFWWLIDLYNIVFRMQNLKLILFGNKILFQKHFHVSQTSHNLHNVKLFIDFSISFIKQSFQFLKLRPSPATYIKKRCKKQNHFIKPFKSDQSIIFNLVLDPWTEALWNILFH